MIKTRNTDEFIKIIRNEDTSITFLDTGDIKEIRNSYYRVNQLVGNPFDGSITNLHLRIFTKDGIKTNPLIGVKSNSEFTVENNKAFYKGEFEGVTYKVIANVVNRGWVFDIELTTNTDLEVDVVYTQDMLLAGGGNEAYTSHYIDHEALKVDNGYVVCSKDTQGGKLCQVGSFNKTVGFVTDGFQLYGLSYKKTNKIEGLYNNELANDKYQYEFAMPALATEKVKLNGTKTLTFYGLLKNNVPTRIKDPLDISALKEEYSTLGVDFSVNAFENTTNVKRSIKEEILFGNDFTEAEITKLYENINLEERDANGNLIAFFTDNSTHVVLNKKELLVERPHGHVMFNHEIDFTKEILSTTTYMNGLFNSHIVLGNTNLNKLTSNQRNPLNVSKASGMRFYVKQKGQSEYKILGMPSVYEIGVSYTKWIYKLDNDVIEIRTYAFTDEATVKTEFISKNNTYDVIVTNQIAMAETEGNEPFEVEVSGNEFTYRPVQGSFMRNTYDGIAYKFSFDTDVKYATSGEFFTDGIDRSYSHEVYKIENNGNFAITITSTLYNELSKGNGTFEAEVASYAKKFTELSNNFDLSNVDGNLGEKYNASIIWFTHNALTHYISPHGLEQYGGAAWGSRDVCQGPVELFMGLGQIDMVRKILLEIFKHQFISTGNWPQWFMFDRFLSIQAHESHGDIIVWPLRTVGKYLQATKDVSILDEKIPYMDLKTNNFTEEKVSLLDHIKKEVQYIKDHFYPGTHLPMYDDGDWNDSLQPNKPELKENLVSSWTSLLLFEALDIFSEEIKEFDKEYAKELRDMADSVKEDVNKYIIKDGVASGFVLFEDGTPDLIIHPTDTKTGLKYRLLPQNRGIISSLFTQEQAENSVEIINRELLCNDGARLFDHAIEYRGGECSYFKRAESSSCVGREVGIFYVHAHIRYVEAMIKLGKADEAFRGLNCVNPIDIKNTVSNAAYRQSNAYFSSSDANTKDRYEYFDKYQDVKDGKIEVKGGWRVYSSGAGMLVNQIVTLFLGVQSKGDKVVIDPVLPKELYNAKLVYKIDGKDVTLNFKATNSTGVTKVLVNGEEVGKEFDNNKYRKSGMEFSKSVLKESMNEIEIHVG